LQTGAYRAALGLNINALVYLGGGWVHVLVRWVELGWVGLGEESEQSPSVIREI